MASAGSGAGQLDWAAVVINWNGAADLAACLAALHAQTCPPAELVVVDNASTDESLTLLRGLGSARVIASPENLGFAGGANAGIRATQAALIATLNPDVSLSPDWAATLLPAFAGDPRLAAAGGKLLYPGGDVIQHAGGAIEHPLLVAANIGRGERDNGQYDAAADVDFITGGALLLRRSALDVVGAFDESFYPAYYEDVDLCGRLRAAGWRVRYLPDARGIHRESASVDGRSAAYYRMIHTGRLRFATKVLPPRELVARFLPAEAARIARALQHLGGPYVADESGLTALSASLAGPMPAPRAHGAAVDSSEPLSGPPPAAEERAADRRADQFSADPRSLIAQLADVGRRWLVEERPFTSTTPLLAPLIVWLRTAVTNAGPRWHVRQILAQQVEFNAAVYRSLSAIAAEAQAARLGGPAAAAALAAQIEALAEQQATLLARLEALDARVSRLAHGRTAEPEQEIPSEEGPAIGTKQQDL